MFKEWGKTEAEVTTKVNTAWNKLFVNGTSDEKIYTESGSDMAYIYTADSNDVRSEGMSYGMMMCVQMNDQTRFDKLWKWARTYMYNTVNNGSNNRGYFSWQCRTDGSKMDQGPAPDGEEYFITALLFAHARWGSASSGIKNYAKEARQIIYDLTRRKPGNGDPYGEPSMFNTDNYMVRFATLGNSATFTDPSYHLPAFYDVWAVELQSDYDNNKLYDIWSSKADLKTDIDFFKQAATVSRNFFKNATNGTTGLGPDYSEWNGTAKNEGDHKYFEYDAWRIAMNIGMDYAWWAADNWQKTFADRIQAFFVGKGVTTYGNRWTLDGTQRGADHSPGLVGCNAVASLAATSQNAWKFIEDFWNVSMTTGNYRYYDGCLYMMSMLHLSGNFKAYISASTTPSSSISPDTATFDKKTGQQADIAVTMTLNGNTLSNIKNGSTTLTSGTNYTTSGSTVTIKTSYLSTLSVGTATLTFNFSGGSSRDLVITVVDTSNSSITPTTATFDKRSDLQANIVVTMTLSGNTLSNIKNGSTTLTSGASGNYTVSGSTVTINKSYLSGLSVGTATLTFTFSAGATSSLVITVKESAPGAAAGTGFDFSSITSLPAGYPKYDGSGLAASITGGVLAVTKTGGYSTPKLILPFNLGTKTLANYSSIKIKIRGKSGDYGNKELKVEAGSTTVASVSNSGLGTTFTVLTMTISNGSGFTGDVELKFSLTNTNPYEIEIESIELVQ
jgi:oligosaccharide reducing-end xylanase